MGGIVGLAAAATMLRERISALLLNDVTPAAPDIEGLRRIAGYMANPRRQFGARSSERPRRICAPIYAPAGPRSDDAWRATAEASLRRLPNGNVTTHYDPAIARAFENLESASDLWDAYDALSIPVFLMRGERSDIASAADAGRMTQRGPMARVRELPGIGHAPWLDSPEQIDLVREFFLDRHPERRRAAP